MNVLIIGSGGREHAIAVALRRSSRLEDLYVMPGNAGTAALGTNVEINIKDHAAVIEFARQHQIGLVVVGPEAPLADGVVDSLQAAGIRTFGPTKAAAQLESSKAFSKDFMRSVGIPTAQHAAFSDYVAALRYLETCKHPVVVKADGLAAGKGVIICDDRDDAAAAVTHLMRGSAFGAAGGTVIIEERLTGPELSVLAFCDGKTVVPMPPARDHKRIGDGDRGPNTGGMGAYAPVPDIPKTLVDQIVRRVLQPAVNGMAERGMPFVGVLFAGLMLTPDGVRTLEFNVRFGDPETQAILPLLDSDLLDIFDACIDGTLRRDQVRWLDGVCATIVLAAANYPAEPRRGDPIQLPAQLPESVVLYHAGTESRGQQIVTAGGRVLAVSAVGPTLDDALQAAYFIVSQVHFDGMQYRRDIGRPPQAAYARAGVDIAAGARATDLMKGYVRSTYTRAVLSEMGAFSGLYDASEIKAMSAPILVASTDGVGTKTMVAARMNRWDTIGRDLVNHCVNDILVQGGRPLFFMDYVASSKLDAEQIATVVRGVAEACREIGCVLLGGETAEMPGVYQPGEIDLAGTMVGVVERDALIDGTRVSSGDAVLALPSTGLHTNGYSLARLALQSLDWQVPHPQLDGQSIGAALLAVHRCYLNEVSVLRSAGIDIKALAHITGGGVVDNVPRVLPAGTAAVIRRGTWPEPPIFGLIARHAQVDVAEQFHALNMGIGMIVIVPADQIDAALATAPELRHVGEIVTGERTVTIEAPHG
ncbi:MAG: phosphoribosylamine--glycine ligase [Anaerolineae bacterium]|nr:phosphoribosylamine--glycine ligase [Anaerolineae bacterium]